MLKIYNSLTREKEEFKPLKQNRVGLYVCGPTVYDAPHIGHARSAYIFDCIRRYFEYKGYAVKFVRNVTDIDDKIINKARLASKAQDLAQAVKDVADSCLDSYRRCMDALGIRRPDYEPKATQYIDKMIVFIAGLIDGGYAYEARGDVYFDVDKACEYGCLSHQSKEMMDSGPRRGAGGLKRAPLDFALWKRAKEGEPFWPSPWGKGRPGWHIECSAMSSDILGDEFDIHGGGIDLIFPHHENEVAQSRAAGKKFARYWMHNGLLTINKEKMAKSLGNFITIDEVLKRYHADVLKILFLQTHYSHPVDFSWPLMEEKKKAWGDIIIFLESDPRLGAVPDGLPAPGGEETGNRIKEAQDAFEAAMDDDFNMPAALAVIFTLSSYGKKLPETASYADMVIKVQDKIKEMGAVLGLTLTRPALSEEEKRKIEEKVALRREYKKQKKYAEADSIRHDLEAGGIAVEDGKDGSRWYRMV